ncbi:MAG TPA: aminodeoxychorismate synthase component I [Vicinamibacterales bacterium]|nr:aminodeoxychorismate synthase component I [Vicinamibacterales bacterium]
MTRVVVQIDAGTRWLSMRDPVQVIEVRDAARLVPALRDVERLTRDRGWYAAGFVTYEAGAAFGLRTCPPDATLPLAWFALFDREHTSATETQPCAPASNAVSALTPSIDEAAFDAAFATVRDHIGRGDTYQVNYTFDLRGRFDGDPAGLFADLVATQRGSYSAYIDTGSTVICSASPELFFARTGQEIVTRPMKGTARRGRTVEEDAQVATRLRESPKERAENVMIVDMMRNDLGRIAETGTVDVPELFSLERYPTIWQMTSTVTARSSADLASIFAALHPSASVTGAPKVRTMEIISAIERRPRGVYTGAIGVVTPDGGAQFNVAIRTAVIDVASGALTFGVGSGIVWDSQPGSEYQECLLKAAVLIRKPRRFDLLETMKWTPEGGFFLLDRHLGRMAQSAGYFAYPWRDGAVRSALERAVSGLAAPQRVRLTYSSSGDPHVECTPLPAGLKPARLGIAATPVDPSNVLLYHKTTERTVYADAMLPDCDDVVLWNPSGEVTESTLGNVVVELGGRKITPPVDTGLLAGTFREELLERGDIVEARVTLDDLASASRIWIVNSVREWWPAQIVGSPEGLRMADAKQA